MSSISPTSNPPWVTIIMVNYNAKPFLQSAIDAIAAQTDQNYAFILVDNASADGSITNLKTDHLANYKLIQMEENLSLIHI